MRICLPPKQIVSSFTDLVEPLYDSICENENESRVLGLQRDVLLPQLLTGKLEVNVDG